MTKFNILPDDQFGFRAKFSTEYAIMDIYDKLIHNLDKGLSSCAIFLDLAKAFDSVSHEILLRKMQHYGIRGKTLELFKSYLNSRSQYIKLNGCKSSLMGIDFGVPQGSISGPLLPCSFIFAVWYFGLGSCCPVCSETSWNSGKQGNQNNDFCTIWSCRLKTCL